MRKLVLFAFLPIIYSCGSSDAKELELLKRENDLLKREKQLATRQVTDNKNKEIEQLNAKKENARRNWNSLILCSFNASIDKAFGGVTNGKIKVTNNTDFEITDVVVMVNYVKDNGANYKTEMVEISSILPNSSEFKQIPDSDRGTSLQTSFVNIRSEQMNFCYPQAQKRGNTDPFFCK